MAGMIDGMDDLRLVHSVELDDIGSMYMIMHVQEGFYSGDVTHEPPVLPHMGLGRTLTHSNEFYDKVKQDVLGVMCRYSICHDNTMLMLGKLYAHFRDPTDEEIRHDIDHFGIEQILWPFEFYAAQSGKAVDELPGKLKTFPVFGEPHIYVGPSRMERAKLACVVDLYQPRNSVEDMLDYIEARKPESSLHEIGDSGFMIALVHHDSPAVMEGVRDRDQVDIKRGYDQLMETIADETEEHREMIRRERDKILEEDRHYL